MSLRRSPALAAVLVVCIALSLAACDGDRPAEPRAGRPSPEPSATGPETVAVATRGKPMEPGKLKAPPPVVVRAGGEAIALHAWTYCYESGCADGMPPADPPDLGDPEEVLVEFPLPDWSFTATFAPTGEKCGREQRVPLRETGDGGFVLRPAGRAGTYDVTLFGRGNGDLVVTFRWTTPNDGRLPKPRARLAVLADNNGSVDSYGIEMEVRNLARTPRDLVAKVTVTSSEGNSLTFRPELARRGCRPEGTLYWDGPDHQGGAAATLGEAPFTYEVELILDGERYVANASWPEDEMPSYGPSVRLFFEPRLPGLS